MRISRTFRDARLLAVYKSWQGAHLLATRPGPQGHAYTVGWLHPDIPDRYPRDTATWAAWCAGVDDKRRAERESGRTYHPPAQPRLPYAD